MRKRNALIMGRLNWESIPTLSRNSTAFQHLIISRTMPATDVSDLEAVRNVDPIVFGCYEDAVTFVSKHRTVLDVGGCTFVETVFIRKSLQKKSSIFCRLFLPFC